MQKMTRVSARAKATKPAAKALAHRTLTANGKKTAPAWHKPLKPIYALAAYTVEKRGTKWYVIRTAEQNAGRTTWRGPYATLDRATLAIAKLLSLEVIERHKRMSDWYGDPA